MPLKIISTYLFAYCYFIAIRVVASVNGAYSTTVSGESRALQANLDKIDIYSNSWGGADGTTFTGPSRNVNDAIIKVPYYYNNSVFCS